ncbi:MAG: peptide chain release factor N(5)-glutamine methyltransferase [candidate division WOR-3 bacterium]|nr:MAG: peptide chain release factor N(5)-glutamine methyltransferase [candidate division WOR-3 bacterium]
MNRDSAELIIAALLGKPRHEIYADETNENLDHGLLHARLIQLKNDIPLEYLTKSVQFRDFDISIEPGVFIPRVETEYLIDVIADEITEPPRCVLDIGTGSGVLAIALARRYPDSRITATDVSHTAIRCARKNIRTHRLESRIELVRCSLFDGLIGTFDLIVSNPPYIPSERLGSLPRSVRDYEPRLALDGGPHGIRVIQRILSQAKHYTHETSLIALEIDDNEVSTMRDMLENDRTLSYSLHKDLFGRNRYCIATFT